MYENWWEKLRPVNKKAARQEAKRNMAEIINDWRQIMAKGTPKRDGSGRGTRNNRGRGGCKPTKNTGKGKR